jgi:acyl-CoA synthetase (AMP-forming)/AMP-acid ligase II
MINYLLPKDVLNALHRERVTGLTAVPPLYIQLAQLKWPESIDSHLRDFANTGCRMPLETLTALRAKVPRAKPFLMYGLTEAFRSTYLPPEEVDRRPDSIGKAIPNAEVLVLRPDGTPCASTSRAARPSARWWRWDTGTIRRKRRNVSRFFRPRRRVDCTRDRRVFRRHRAQGCRRLSFSSTPRRNDQDIRISGKPD